MKKYIKCSTYTIEDLENAIEEIWNDVRLSNQIRSLNDYRAYFNKTYGWDNITTEEFDKAWNNVDSKYTSADDIEDGIQIGSRYYTLDTAIDWLNNKLAKYGNTYFFPQKDLDILDKLVSKFGNTYFWTN